MIHLTSKFKASSHNILGKNKNRFSNSVLYVLVFSANSTLDISSAGNVLWWEKFYGGALFEMLLLDTNRKHVVFDIFPLKSLVDRSGT